MSETIDLVRAILGTVCVSDAQARMALDSALALEAEPLAYFIHRFGLIEVEVAERCAAWVGLAFSPVVPPLVTGSAQFSRIDDLGNIRTLRGTLFDREVIFLSPEFFHLARLRAHIGHYPHLVRDVCLVPGRALRAGLGEAHTIPLLEEARHRLVRRWPFASANLDLSLMTRIFFVLLVMGVAAVCALAPLWMGPVVLPFIGAILLVPALFRLVAVTIEPKGNDLEWAPPVSEADLPIYSILIPLRDEAQMVPLLQRAMTNLDYPPEKLDIKFVVEADNIGTVEAVRALLDDCRFELVQVPDASPRTKPKALNYALPFVRGEYVVVYDAEDIPAPDQLRLAAARFAHEPELDCLQAELSIDNAEENWLAALFAGEYAGQFRVMLPALARWHLPMPLGGTSNHFRTHALREIGGWDSFNVTEDADLGIRMARLRYRTKILESETREEAPIALSAWMAQRTRWMKGWMQTFIVHNRDPDRLLSDIGWRRFLAFEIYSGSMILSPLLHTAFICGALLGLFTGGGVLTPAFTALGITQTLIFFAGYSGAIGLVVVGLIRRGQTRLLVYQLALPAYWVLHSIATVRAAIDLLIRPYFWAKTTHGRTRIDRKIPAQRRDEHL